MVVSTRVPDSSGNLACSLVKKDAGMLDAFGKGASEDIQLAKSELYSQMTWDKDSKSSSFAEPQVTTPLPSPPPSPKPRKSSLEDTSKQLHSWMRLLCFTAIACPSTPQVSNCCLLWPCLDNLSKHCVTVAELLVEL